MPEESAMEPGMTPEPADLEWPGGWPQSIVEFERFVEVFQFILR